MPDPPQTLQTLLSHLLPQTHLTRPLSPSQPSPSINAAISALQLHPTLEAALHILNADLSSAHFLVRHMQAPPAVEGMLLHSILHRCEGDFGNARAWLGDVGDCCEGWVAKKRGDERLEKGVWEGVGLEGEQGGLLGFVYGVGSAEEGEKVAGRLVDDVEGFRGSKGKDGEGEKETEEKIRGEMESVVEWCRRKFGDQRWEDASSAWVKHGEEVRKMAEDMVSGDKGWRKY